MKSGMPGAGLFLEGMVLSIHSPLHETILGCFRLVEITGLKGWDSPTNVVGGK